MRFQLKLLTALFALMYFSATALAADASSLKPPPGAKVAVVVFEDLECPTCAVTYPVVWEAANAHKVPVMLYDFPIPKHAWSFDAAIYARFFDTKSRKLGDDFRGFIYKNQPNVMPSNLRMFAQKFADDNKVPLPFVIDPDGKLKALVRADYDLGVRINVVHTPTIFVIGVGGATTPYVEVEDRSKLSQAIEDMQKKMASVATAPAKKTVRTVRKKG